MRLQNKENETVLYNIIVVSVIYRAYTPISNYKCANTHSTLLSYFYLVFSFPIPPFCSSNYQFHIANLKIISTIMSQYVPVGVTSKNAIGAPKVTSHSLECNFEEVPSRCWASTRARSVRPTTPIIAYRA